ncbi:MAG: hypothetical protein CFE34_04075 [Rhodobacteraceae bacterium PARR1]|nr:MAG: hypothetical protein CFE34_04075 [Rhodobacteraceae bacterium PARR1]
MPRTTLARNAAPVAQELRAWAWTGGQRDGKLRLCGCKTVAGTMFQDKDCFERFAVLIVGAAILGVSAIGLPQVAAVGGVAVAATELWARVRGKAQSDAPKVVARLSAALRDEWDTWGKTSSQADENLRASARASFEAVIDRLNLDPDALVGQRLNAQAVADLALSRAAAVFPEAYANTDPKNATARLTRKFLHDVTLRAYGFLLNDAEFVNGIAPALWRGVLGQLDRVEATHNRIEEKIDALALSQREKEGLLVEVATLKAKLGTTQSMILTFLEDIRQRAVQPDQITAELFRIAGEWRSLGERIDALPRSQNLTPELNRLRDQAQAAYEAEDQTRALDLWTQIEVAEEKALNSVLAHQREVADEVARRTDGVINAKAAKRNLYATQSNVAETVRLTVEIVQLGLAKGGSLFAELHAEWQRWHERGRDKGLNFDLEVSVDVARAALDHAANGVERSKGNNLLGAALSILGERQGREDQLKAAISAFRAALIEQNKDLVPEAWAITQSNLGNALRTLGELRHDLDLLEEAITAYRAALKEQARDQVPLDWARTQNNLGNALRTLGERRGSPEFLEQAVNSYGAALIEYTQDHMPWEWAGTQNNLGNALASLGEMLHRIDLLEQAVIAYHAALSERTQERVPLDWAMTMANKAILHLSLHRMSNDPTNLELARQAAIEARDTFEKHSTTAYADQLAPTVDEINRRLSASP